MKTIRTIAVIGCGRIAVNAHLPALSKLDEVRIKYACDIEIAKAESAKSKFPKIEKVISDYRTALTDDEVEAVFVLTPNYLHYEISMAALESGTVKLHLTSSPFIYQERENPNYNELTELSEVWPSGNTFLVAMAAQSVLEDEALYNALRAAFDEAIAYINEDEEGIIAIESDYLESEPEQVKGYLDQPDCQFSTELKGVQDMADFMYRADFIEREVAWDELVYAQ